MNIDYELDPSDINKPSLDVEQLAREATERAAKVSECKRDLIIACMYIDYCQKQHFNLYRHIDELNIKVDSNDHYHICFGNAKIGEIWPPDFEEKRDDHQAYIEVSIRYEPFAWYHKDQQIIKKAEDFLHSFRHIINSQV